MSSVASVLADFAVLLAELLALFVVVAFAVALAARCVGIARLRRWIGGRRLPAALKGIALGFATPFCTYSAIPVLTAMVDARVRTAGWAGFVLAAPVLDPLIAAAIAVIFSPQAALLYTGATFAGVLAMALVADTARLDRLLAPRHVSVTAGGGVPTSAMCAADDSAEAACADPFTDGGAWQGWRSEVGRAGRYALDLVGDMALPLVAAVVVAAVIAGFVPEGLLVSVAGPGNPLAVPAAAVLGAPFYVSGEAFLPIAAALLDRGMGTGAVFALIIAGTGVNVPEFVLLGRVFDRSLLVLLVAAVVGIAVAAGYLAGILL